MSLSSTSCLAAFLGSFQRRGIASSQRKLGQKLPLFSFSFSFTYVCLYTFSNIYIIYACWKHLNDQSSWFLLSHVCNYFRLSSQLMYWSLYNRLSQSQRDLSGPSISNRGTCWLTWVCPGFSGYGGTTGLWKNMELSQGGSQGKLRTTQEREYVFEEEVFLGNLRADHSSGQARTTPYPTWLETRGRCLQINAQIEGLDR